MGMRMGTPDHGIDTELMLRLQGGEDHCLDELMLRHWSYVRLFAQRIVRNEAASEDIAQEAFLRVYGARLRYQPAARFTTWLGTITSNLSFNWLRNHRHERLRGESLETNHEARRPIPVPDHRPLPDESLEIVQQRRQLSLAMGDAMSRLPRRQRRALWLQVYGGLSYAAIAREMGCSEHSVKSLLFRAHRTLRGHLSSAAS
jgi:RNA polymerase sigma-70 factor (ECF subfamily)